MRIISRKTLRQYRVMYIRFVGTHRQYDAIDVTEV